MCLALRAMVYIFADIWSAELATSLAFVEVFSALLAIEFMLVATCLLLKFLSGQN